MYAEVVIAEHTSLTDPRSPLPATATPRPGLILPLTSVRFAAALYVAVYHMVRPFSRWGPLEQFFSAGYAAVSFFFVLSGFILAYTYAADFEAGKARIGRFWLARFARIYPVYLLCTGIAAYVYRSQFRPRFHVVAFVADLFMVQSWSTRMVNFFNVPAWSLSVEAFFYAIFPLIVVKLRPRRPGGALLLLVGMWLLAMAAPVFTLFTDHQAAWREDGSAQHLYTFAFRRYPIFALPEFAAGIVLGWFHLCFRLGAGQSRVLLGCGMAGALLLLGFSGHLPYELLHNGLLIPFYAMIILGLCYPSGIASLLSWRPLLLLGESSYALYLVHFALNDYLQGSWHWQPSRAMLLPRLLLVIPISVAFYLLIERPGRRAILARFGGGSARQ